MTIRKILTEYAALSAPTGTTENQEITTPQGTENKEVTTPTGTTENKEVTTPSGTTEKKETTTNTTVPKDVADVVTAVESNKVAYPNRKDLTEDQKTEAKTIYSNLFSLSSEDDIAAALETSTDKTILE